MRTLQGTSEDPMKDPSKISIRIFKDLMKTFQGTSEDPLKDP